MLNVRQDASRIHPQAAAPVSEIEFALTAKLLDPSAAQSEPIVFELRQSSLATQSAENHQASAGPVGEDTVTGGAGNDTLLGTAGDDSLDGGGGADRMAGGLGNDTYIVDNIHDVVIEKLRAGMDTILSSVTYTVSTHVESLTLIGSANINAIGNGISNLLIGNSGNNILNGGAGLDTLIGGLGNDTYFVDRAGDQVIEAAEAGIDTVRSSVDWTLGANFEKLNLTGSADSDGIGNALANSLTGNSGNNRLMGLEGDDLLVGNAGDDTLDGGLGADKMRGGTGNDWYVVNKLGDKVFESAGAGTDTVYSSKSYHLGANVENLVLAGSANLVGSGNGLNNWMIGNSGDNTLDGSSGNDTLSGGVGNDTYIVDAANDIVNENSGEGTDSVQASINYILGANLENLVLTGSAGLFGTGNGLNNQIVGNDGFNALDGGLGADTLLGGLGNDSYIVDSANDVVVENPDEGTDTLQSSISYTLGDNLENLVLTGTSGISGTGNELNNEIIGNAGNNTLNGGFGNDTLMGGMGDDSYMVDSTNDAVVENEDEGIDAVYSDVSYTLGANIENLYIDSGQGIGNDLDNRIQGGFDSAVVLDGGAGNDTLAGDFYADTLIAGSGDDSLNGDYGDNVFMMEGGGSDTVFGYAVLSYKSHEFHYDQTLSVTDQSSNSLTLSADGDDLIMSFGGSDQITIQNGLNYYYLLDTYIFSDTTLSLAQLFSTHSFTLSSSDDHVSFAGLPSAIAVSVFAGAGDDVVEGASGGGNSLDGGDGNDELKANSYHGGDILIGGAGDDTLISGASGATLFGGTGSDTFIVGHSLQYGPDWVDDFSSMNDRLRVDQLRLPVGNGNTTLDGAVSRAAPGGFAESAELVIFTSDISGSLTASSAAAQIGSATSAYTPGQTALFVVDNGQDSAVYYFKSAGTDAVVSSSELTLLATLNGTPATDVADYMFGT